MAYKLSPITERVQKMRAKYRDTQPEICLSRYKIITEFYMNHPELGGILRRAKAFYEICKNIARVDTEEELEALPEARTAVLLASIYLYEHRGDADFHKLMLNLRALMMSRNPAF